MDIIECPHCKTRVLPMGGECPACRRRVDDSPEAASEVAPRADPPAPGRPAPAPRAEAGGSLATVETFEFEAAAEEARNYLEDRGIPAFLADAKTVGMNWLLGNAVGYIKLQVPPDQAGAARELLREARDGRGGGPEPLDEDAEAAAEDEGEDDAEDRAGVMNTLRGMKRVIFWIILSPMVIGLLFLVMYTLAWLARWVGGAVGLGNPE